jgi:hypothetical protein
MTRRNPSAPPMTERQAARSLESVFQHCLKLATDVLASRADHFDHVGCAAPGARLHSKERRRRQASARQPRCGPRRSGAALTAIKRHTRCSHGMAATLSCHAAPPPCPPRLPLPRPARNAVPMCG